MSNMLKIIGYTWAFPVTFIGLTYASFFKVMGWYKWHGIEGDAMVWLVDHSKSPNWLKNLWKGWGGHAIGNVIILSESPQLKPMILKHEQKHVDQVMKLGIFQPFIYAISSIGIYLGCSGSDHYYSNPFEVDARRHAGQIIDVEGYVKKINEIKEKNEKEKLSC